jgi:transaldolase
MAIMRLFLDTANIDEIRDHRDFIDGVTTNPTLVARESGDLKNHLQKIITVTGKRTVMVEVIAEDPPGMIAEGRQLAMLGPDILVKIPATREGLAAVRVLSGEGIRVTVTLVFSPLQALLAAAAGATAIALFIGRLDDAGGDGAAVLKQAVEALRLHGYSASIVAASLRSAERAQACALAGAHILTLPAKVADALLYHPLTVAGLDKFAADWRRASAESVPHA